MTGNRPPTKRQIAERLARCLPLLAHKLRQHEKTRVALIKCHVEIGMSGSRSTEELARVAGGSASKLEEQLECCPFFRKYKGRWVHSWPECAEVAA